MDKYKDQSKHRVYQGSKRSSEVAENPCGKFLSLTPTHSGSRTADALTSQRP